MNSGPEEGGKGLERGFRVVMSGTTKRKLLHIVGNRPQFIKLAALLRRLPEEDFSNVVVHSGQHYDYNMSKVFFEELGLPKPDYFLECGSGSHDAQTARVLEGLNPLWTEVKPDFAIVYGDTNTTLAGALSAYKAHVPLAHVEAGFREFSWRPEEINRTVADHCADICFCSSALTVKNLMWEGIPASRTHLTGDVTYDSFLWAVDKLRTEGRTLTVDDNATLVTLHRAETVDDDRFLARAAECLLDIGGPVYFPVHPRTNKNLRSLDLWGRLEAEPQIHLLPPLGYFEFLAYLIACSAVVTDSGGVTREAYYAKKPTVVMDDKTSYIELIDAGAIILSGRNPARIHDALQRAINSRRNGHSEVLGDGKAAEKIGRLLKSFQIDHGL